MMKILNSEFKQCPYCMEKHEVKVVEVEEKCTFKGELVKYIATYEYCANLKELWATDKMLRDNDLALKDAYKKKVGLLTSDEIKAIRKKYGMSQEDFSDILGLGRKTITRYENHYVQAKSQDNMIKRVRNDYEYLLELLEARMACGDAPDRYAKYHEKIKELIDEEKYTFVVVSTCNFNGEMCFEYDFATNGVETLKYNEKTVTIEDTVNSAA